MKLQFKRGPQANLPVLDVGEPGLTTDQNRVFVGGTSGNIEIARKSDLTAATAPLASATYVDTQVSSVNAQLSSVNAQLSSVNAQLADIAISVKSFGAKGDGVTDDTAAVQAAINSLPNGGSVVFPKDSYLINGVIAVKNNIRLIGNGSTILTTATTPSNSLFTVAGTINPTVYTLAADALQGTSVITFSTLPPVAVGDALSISQVGTTPANSYYLDVVRVESINVSSKQVTVEMPLMHDFLTSLTASAQQVTLSKNVEISGFEFILSTTQDLSPIQLFCAENVVVKDIKASGFGGCAIYVNTALNFTIDNVIAENPSNADPGRGYAVKVHQGSAFGVISNIYGYKTRHCVDVAGGSHTITVADSVGVKNTVQSFGTHGMHERNITFQGCKSIKCALNGGFTIGNASYGRSEHVTLINCTAYFSDDVGFMITLSDNVTMVGCKSYYSINQNYLVISATNVNVSDSESVGATSFIKRSSYVTFDNVMFSGLPTNKNSIEIYDTCNYVKISNCDINDGGDYGIKLGDTTAGLFPASTEITIEGCRIVNSFEFCIVAREDVTAINIRDNVLIANSSASALIVFPNAQKTVVKNNRIKGGVSIRPLKNAIFSGNYGEYTMTTAMINDVPNVVINELNYPFVP